MLSRRAKENTICGIRYITTNHIDEYGDYSIVKSIMLGGKLYVLKCNSISDHDHFHRESKALKHLTTSTIDLPETLLIAPQLHRACINKSTNLILELIPGQSLFDVLTNSDLMLLERLSLCKLLIDTVERMHELGVVHLNLTPTNVIIYYRDGNVCLRIIDYDDSILLASTDSLINDQLIHALANRPSSRYQGPSNKPWRSTNKEWAFNQDHWALILICYLITGIELPPRDLKLPILVKPMEGYNYTAANGIAKYVNSSRNITPIGTRKLKLIIDYNYERIMRTEMRTSTKIS